MAKKKTDNYFQWIGGITFLILFSGILFYVIPQLKESQITIYEEVCRNESNYEDLVDSDCVITNRLETDRYGRDKVIYEIVCPQCYEENCDYRIKTHEVCEQVEVDGIEQEIFPGIYEQKINEYFTKQDCEDYKEIIPHKDGEPENYYYGKIYNFSYLNEVVGYNMPEGEYCFQLLHKIILKKDINQEWLDGYCEKIECNCNDAVIGFECGNLCSITKYSCFNKYIVGVGK